MLTIKDLETYLRAYLGEDADIMMGDFTDYDYRCGRCGRGYYADVGEWACPHCGSYTSTKSGASGGVSDEAYTKSMIEFAMDFDSPETVVDDKRIDPEVAKRIIREEVMKYKKLYEALDV